MEETLAKLGILGVVRHTDANAYRCYPSLADPVHPAPAGSWSTASTGTIVAAGSGPSNAYYLMGLAAGQTSAPTVPNTEQITILDTASNALRRLAYPASSGIMYCAFPPIKVVGGRGMTFSAIGYGGLLLKAQVLTTEPRVMHPSWCLEYTDLYQTGGILPATSGGTTLTSAAGAWTMGSYAQITASTATAILVTSICLVPNNGALKYDVDLATGAGGSEVVVGSFSIPSSYSQWAPIVHDLRPFALYVPSGIRIAARCADSAGSGTCRIMLEYLSLPL